MDKGPRSLQSSLPTFTTMFYFHLFRTRWNKEVCFSVILPPDETHDSNSVFLLNSHMSLVPQQLANNYQKEKSSEAAATRQGFSFPAALRLTWVMDSWHFKHNSCFLCSCNTGGADKNNGAASLGPVMKTSVFLTVLASHLLSAYKDLLLGKTASIRTNT